MTAANTQKKSPLFSGPYYLELLRELKTIGILFTVFQAILGFASEFGSSYSILFSILTLGLSQSDLLIAYFLFAGIKFNRSHLRNGTWDSRASLPIAKKTVIVSHILAALTVGLIVFASRFVGAFVAELVLRIPGLNVTEVPPAFGATALTMLNNMLYGLMLYSLIVTVGSVTQKTFSGIIAMLTVFFAPRLYMNVASAFSESTYSFSQLFFPIGTRARSALGWAALILAAAAALIITVFAYSKSRAETIGKPARAPWIHVAIGVGFAVLIGLNVLSISLSTVFSLVAAAASGASELKSADLAAVSVVAVVLMLIGYFVYMWITLRSFKNAAKRLVFFPIAILVILTMVPLVLTANAKWKKLDFSAENIKQVRILDGTFESGGYSGIYLLDSAGASDARGRSGAEKIVFDDPALIKLVAEQAKGALRGNETNSIEYAILSNYINMSGNVEVILKDGTVWTVPVDMSELMHVMAEKALRNSDYIERFASLDRFAGARIFAPAGLGKEFEKTFFDELKSLPAAERAVLMSDTLRLGSETSWGTGFGLDLGGAMIDTLTTYGTVTIVSPTYDHVARIAITDRMPKTAALYVKLTNDNSKHWDSYDEFIRRLENGEYTYFEAQIIGDDNMTVSIYIDDNDEDTVGLKKRKEGVKLLADALRRDPSNESEGKLVRLDIMNFATTDPAAGRSYSVNGYRDLISGKTKEFFVRLTDEELAQLIRLCDWASSDYKEYR